MMMRRVHGAASAITDRYRRFAEHEAPGRSAVYVDLARHVATDERALAFLVGLPRGRRQPNLLFGAVQYLRGPLNGRAAFDEVLAEQPDELARVMRARNVQTNLPARCATLLPVLAALPQPLVLVEVGASAGLCLYPDRYAYDYDGHHVSSADGAPVLRCRASPGTPLPDGPVEVAWRAGLDMNPLDVSDPDDLSWLEALIWPGEEHLCTQLHAAAAIVRADPPLLVVGDLARDLPDLLARAPDVGTLVVFHTAVLPYVPNPAARQALVDDVRAAGAVWVAQESPALIPGVEVTDDHPPATFLVCRNGFPLARADPHGAWIEWLS